MAFEWLQAGVLRVHLFSRPQNVVAVKLPSDNVGCDETLSAANGAEEAASGLTTGTKWLQLKPVGRRVFPRTVERSFLKQSRPRGVGDMHTGKRKDGLYRIEAEKISFRNSYSDRDIVAGWQ